MAIVKPIPYYGDARPCSMYRNGVRLAGYTAREQTCADMLFEKTYNDRVGLTALGKSKQTQMVQGTNLFDPAKSAFSFPATVAVGVNQLIRQWSAEEWPYPTGIYYLSHWADTTGLTYGANGHVGIRIMQYNADGSVNNYVYTSFLGQEVSRKTVSITLTAGLKTQIYFAQGGTISGSYVADEVMLAASNVAYEPFVPDSPSPDYPSPIISAAGGIRAQDSTGARYADVDLPDLRAIPDGAGGWIARDEAYIELVGEVPHLFKVPRVGRKTLSDFPWYVYPDSAGFSRWEAIVSDKYFSMMNSKYVLCTKLKIISYVDYEAWTISERQTYNQLRILAPLGMTTNEMFAVVGDADIDYILATPGDPVDLGPIGLPSYYPYTRVLVSGDYPPDVTAKCREVDDMT